MSVRWYLHIKADVCYVSYCHKVVKHSSQKELCQETFGQHQGPASSASEGLENTDTLLAALDISSGSTDSLFPDETAVQWTVSACCELWVWYLIHIMHLLNLTHHCHSINRDIHVQSTGVYVHINLISQRLWTLWHARGIRPQAEYMNRIQKKHALYCISLFLGGRCAMLIWINKCKTCVKAENAQLDFYNR